MTTLQTIPPAPELHSVFGDINKPFPVDALPCLLAELTHATAEQYGVSPQIPAAVMLGGLSALPGRGILLDTYARRSVAPNLYFFTGVVSSVGKSVTSELLMRPVTARLKRIGDAMRQRQDADDKRDPRTFASDATDASLKKALADNHYGNFALIASDARNLIDNIVGRHNRNRFDGNVLIDGFNGDESHTMRVTTGNSGVERPCVAVSAIVQIAKLAELFECEEAASSGLIPRLLPCVGSREGEIKLENVVTDSMLARWEGLLDELAELHTFSSNPEMVRLDAAAYERYLDFKSETMHLIDSTTCEVMGSVLRRQDEIAFRMALVFHVARSGVKAPQCNVCERDYVGACEVVRWYLPQIAALTGNAAQSAAAALKARVLKAMALVERKKLGRPVTANDLKTYSGIQDGELDSLVETFPGEFRLTEIHTGKPGRPPRIFERIAA